MLMKLSFSKEIYVTLKNEVLELKRQNIELKKIVVSFNERNTILQKKLDEKSKKIEELSSCK